MNYIGYRASSKLTGSNFEIGALWYGDVALVSHDFSDGAGVLGFAGTLTDIQYNAFASQTGLTFVSLPREIIRIESGAFGNCTSLVQLDFYGDAPEFDGADIFEGVPNRGYIRCQRGSEEAFYDVIREYSLNDWIVVSMDTPAEKIESNTVYVDISAGEATSVTVPCSNPFNVGLLVDSDFSGMLYGNVTSTPTGVTASLTLSPSYSAVDERQAVCQLMYTESSKEDIKLRTYTMLIIARLQANEEPPTPPEPIPEGVITFDESAFTQSQYAFEKQVEFHWESLTNVTASCPDSWLKASVDIPHDYLVYGFLNLKAGENTSVSDRKTIVTVSGKDGYGRTISATISVTQKGTGVSEIGYISFSDTSDVRERAFTIDDGNAQGYNIFLYLHDVSAITVTNAYYGWVTSDFVYFPDDEEQEISLYVRPNTTKSERKANIYINGIDANGKKVFSTIRITQSVLPEGNAYIAPQHADYSVAYTGDTYYVEITGVGYDESECSFWKDADWISDITYDDGTFSFTTATNVTGEERVGFIMFNMPREDGQGRLLNFIRVIQGKNPEFIQFPIWKDTEIEFPQASADFIDYRVVMDGETRYTGRAYYRDGKNSVYLNTVLQDLIREEIDLRNTDGMQNSSAFINARLDISFNEGESWQEYLMLRTFNNWSYDDTLDNFISHPISDILDSRQVLVYSYLDLFDTTPFIFKTEFTGKDGFTYRNTYVVENSIQTLVDDLHDKVAYNVGNRTFRIADTCKPYCLYYQNRHGGFDSVLLNDASKQKDSISNLEYTMDGKSGTLQWGRKHYERDITRTWTLNTSILNDWQAEIFTDVLESPLVYLHDLNDDEIVPVTVTDSTAEHKTFANNRKKLITYTITVADSKNRKRR